MREKFYKTRRPRFRERCHYMTLNKARRNKILARFKLNQRLAGFKPTTCRYYTFHCRSGINHSFRALAHALFAED